MARDNRAATSVRDAHMNQIDGNKSRGNFITYWKCFTKNGQRHARGASTPSKSQDNYQKCLSQMQKSTAYTNRRPQSYTDSGPVKQKQPHQSTAPVLYGQWARQTKTATPVDGPSPTRTVGQSNKSKARTPLRSNCCTNSAQHFAFLQKAPGGVLGYAQKLSTPPPRGTHSDLSGGRGTLRQTLM